MKNTYQVPEIPKNSKVIIGIGDSFTQGVGGWSDSTYKKYNYDINFRNLNSEQFKEMYENSWVNQLSKNHMKNYIPINFGRLGIGNRAAFSELHLTRQSIYSDILEGYLIFMLSGLERFDFVNKNFESVHFISAWPQKPHNKVPIPRSWRAYEKEIWSEAVTVLESLISIKNAEIFAKAHNLKLILASAFDQRYNITKFIDILGEQYADLVYSIPWDRFVYPEGYPSFINLLVELDGKPQSLAYGDFWPYYTSLNKPSEYITNCAHPTLKGYEVITNEIYKFISEDHQ